VPAPFFLLLSHVFVKDGLGPRFKRRPSSI